MLQACFGGAFAGKIRGGALLIWLGVLSFGVEGKRAAGGAAMASSLLRPGGLFLEWRTGSAWSERGQVLFCPYCINAQDILKLESLGRQRAS